MPDDERGSPPLSDHSVADLLKQASDQTVTLVRQELDLAKAELTTKAKQAGQGAGLFGAAGAFGVYALGAFTAALILAVGLAVAGWLAALIVAGAYGAIAGVLALRDACVRRPLTALRFASVPRQLTFDPRGTGALDRRSTARGQPANTLRKPSGPLGRELRDDQDVARRVAYPRSTTNRRPSMSPPARKRVVRSNPLTASGFTLQPPASSCTCGGGHAAKAAPDHRARVSRSARLPQVPSGVPAGRTR
jgi:Putative Actinobacterial Holin-X, holin superfamily III